MYHLIHIIPFIIVFSYFIFYFLFLIKIKFPIIVIKMKYVNPEIRIFISTTWKIMSVMKVFEGKEKEKKKAMSIPTRLLSRGGGGNLVSTLPGCVCRKWKDMCPFLLQVPLYMGSFFFQIDCIRLE